MNITAQLILVNDLNLNTSQYCYIPYLKIGRSLKGGNAAHSVINHSLEHFQY